MTSFPDAGADCIEITGIPASFALLTAGPIALPSIVFISLGPPRFRPQTGIPHEVEHVLTFLALGVLVGLAFRERPVLVCALAVPALALLEALQLVAPGRHGYVSDFVVNSLAACLGIAAAALGARALRIICRSARQG